MTLILNPSRRKVSNQ